MSSADLVYPRVDGNTALNAAALALPLLAGSVAAVVYLLTLAPGLTWANFGGDGGELITAAATLGVPHPPGYPTYVLLGKLITLLPLPGGMAWRFNLFSALAATTAVAFAAATAGDLLGRARWPFLAALAGALSLAFAPLVWSQALIAEVYALNLAVLAAFLWALLGERSPWLAGALLGLAVTTHLTSLLMLPLALALCLPGGRARLLAGAALGLLPLLTLPLLAQSGSPVQWGAPLDPAGWWWLVSARIYAPNLALPAADQVAQTIGAWTALLLEQWLWIGWLFAGLGLFLAPPRRAARLALVLTVGLYALFALLNRTDDTAVLLLPVLLLLVPALARGLLAIAPLAPLLPLALLLSGFAAQDLSQEPPLRDQALAVFAAAPPGAVLLTPGDSSLPALWYYQHVEGLRKDLTLVDANLLAFDWYREHMQAQYPSLHGLEQDDLARFQTLNGRMRPFCVLPPALAADLSCASAP